MDGNLPEKKLQEKDSAGIQKKMKPWDGELTDDEIEAEAALQLKYSGKPSKEESKPHDA